MKRIVHCSALALLLAHCFTATWATEVLIPDPSLKSAIWQSLGKSGPVGSLTEQDMLSLTNLYAGPDIKSLEGLGSAHNLFSLELLGNQLTNLTFPAGLTNLNGLDLDGNQLTSLILPRDLSSLGSLSLVGTGQ